MWAEGHLVRESVVEGHLVKGSVGEGLLVQGVGLWWRHTW